MGTTTKLLPVSAATTDRCDRCGAAAPIRVELTSGGELLFCAHHGREHLPKLAQLSAVIHDSREPEPVG